MNDLELVLSEKNIDTQEENYLLQLGISKIDISDIKTNEYVLNAAPYIKLSDFTNSKYKSVAIDDILEPAGNDKVGAQKNIPIMSITMNDGLIDQADKFKKRIASTDISKYNRVYRNNLVVGFPIDEGVLGFQKKYDVAAVSPAYNIWKLKDSNINIDFLEMVLRSLRMREIYKQLMQGSVDRRRSIPDEIFVKIKLPIPSRAIQDKVIEQFKKVEDYKNQIKELEKNIQTDLSNLWV